MIKEHIGSNFDDFLKDEGILEEIEYKLQCEDIVTIKPPLIPPRLENIYDEWDDHCCEDHDD